MSATQHLSRSRPKHPCIACGRGLGRARLCPRCSVAQWVRGLKVEAVLKSGPKGRVYRARAEGEGGEVVVLKEVSLATVPNALTVELFGREGEALRRLSHPRIPRFIDSFPEGEGTRLRHYLVQSHLAGEDLEARLQHHSFDEAEARRIARDLLEIFEYLHTRSPVVVHRDVKPSNLIALEDGHCGLVDFGLVRSGTLRESESPVAGSFGYFPPEQSFRAADERSDLYGLGMTLCRLLSRRDPGELLTPSLEVAFGPKVNLTRRFAGWLERLVAKDPARRFCSAAQALAGLEQPAAFSAAPTSECPALAPPRLPARALQPQPLPERGGSFAHAIPWKLSLGGRVHLLAPGHSYLVGRGDDCPVHIDDAVEGGPTVSRHHLRLTVGAGGVELEELGSRNGTLVGRRYLRPAGERIRVSEGVELQLGELLGELVPAFRVLDGSPRERPLSEARRRKPARPPQPTRNWLGHLGGDPQGVRISRLPPEVSR